MRISTSMMYSLGSDAIGRQQAELLKTQQQMSSGRRILSPSDDPVGAAQGLRVAQQQNLIAQNTDAQGAAKSALSLVESRLGDAGDVMQRIRELALQAGDASLTTADRKSIATEIRGLRDQLLSIANARDGDQWMFAGYRSSAQPFVQSGSSVVYSGDLGQRFLQVSSGRQIAISENGAVFDRVRDGNGTFAAIASATNTGSGQISAGDVANPAALDGHTYRLNFHVVGTATTYDVVDTTAGTTVSTANAYTSGSAITVAGMRITLSGAPADTDSFTLRPSANTSVFDMLDTLATAIDGASTATTNAGLTNALTLGISNIDQAQASIVDTRSGVGARLRELDQAGNASSADKLAADARLSALQDLDYTEAASRLAREQTALQAAEQSYAKTVGLSLFNYL